MVQSFWRIRLGEAVGPKGDGAVFNKCKNENPPCVAVGWGELDLSKDIKEYYKVSIGQDEYLVKKEDMVLIRKGGK